MPRSARRRKCTFQEKGRRCPFDGTGDPPLCRAHVIALAEASRPRSPTAVIADAINNLLAGKPINVEATIGAAENVFQQWAMGGGMAAGYHPSVRAGESENAAHRRAQAGHAQEPPPFWWQAQGPGPRPAAPDPKEQALRQARQVLGFGPNEAPTEIEIKARKKQLARRYHPDYPGGSAAKMAKINGAADLLLESL